MYCGNTMISRLLILISALCGASVYGFSPVTRAFRSRHHLADPTTAFVPSASSSFAPPSLQRQRKSVAAVQAMGLFGLGAPEIAIIFVAAAFLLGPQKLAELGKDAGKIAGELKEVPKEFQRGLAEGEELAKVNKPKEVVSVDSAKDADIDPQKLAELGKDAGKIAGELKEVPKEFQRGLAEGEELAKVNKPKEVVSVDSAKDADTE